MTTPTKTSRRGGELQERRGNRHEKTSTPAAIEARDLVKTYPGGIRQPLPPHSFNSAVTPQLEAIVMRALEKDPARRFRSADAFIDALEGAKRAERKVGTKQHVRRRLRLGTRRVVPREAA